jgi:diaminohydroxyphosphoribosylaminopyrimidine deaminase / 5-amino-6-(5-phosphoribosylamino)uracil reductase
LRLFGDPASSVGDPSLRRAFLLAENGRGTTSPNPLVGCVLTRDGETVGEGWHERAGGPHAEVVALQQAGERARGATAYVTLEPCNHTGRTPACVPSLLASGISRCVIGMRDPNPGVAGGGAAALAAAGVKVTFAEDPSPFEVQNEAWLKHVTTGVPWLQAKVALSLDGHASLQADRPARLSGTECERLTMRLRSAADAVMVGAGTLASDDPALTVRDESGVAVARQPLRVVVSRTSVPRPEARMFADGLGPALVLISGRADAEAVQALVERGVGVERYDADGGLPAALRVLGRMDVTRVLVEAGPRLLEAMWNERALDELVLYHAGGMAGAAAPPLFEASEAASPELMTARLRAVEAGVVGGDAVTVWEPCPGWLCSNGE